MGSKPDLDQAKNLVEVARWQAQHNPERIAVTYLPTGDGEEQEHNLTFGRLDEQARALASELLKNGQPGDRALLLYPSGLDSIIAIYACLYAGMVGVFVGLPRPDASLDPLQAAAERSGAALALTTAAYLAGIRPRVDQSPLQSLCWLATDEALRKAGADGWQPPDTDRDSLAFLLFTSGSTSMPKGVMISHGGVIGEMEALEKQLHIRPDTVGVSWSPLYHIGGLILPLIMPASGMRFVFMSPQSFLERPIRWLKALSKYRASVSSTFNFGIQISVERTTPEERSQLDLSTCTDIVIGGERLRADLIEKFLQTYAPYGFPRSGLKPAFGLTETIGTTTIFDAGSDGYKSYALDLDAVKVGKVALAAPNAEKPQVHVGCGKPVPGKRVVIVDPNTLRACPPDTMGEIWAFNGRIAQGYWKNPEATKEIFQAYLADTNEGPFFRTGDIGCFIEGDLVVTGRIKEMVILHGKNYFAQDLEKTIETAHPQLVPGSMAAFALSDDSEERLGFACEVAGEVGDAEADRIISAVREAVAREQHETVHLVGLVKSGGLPRSSSGKLLRYACRESLVSGALDMIKLSRLEDPGEQLPDEDGSGYAAPRTAIERALAGIWASVLRKARVGVNDNFFDLGGDSLLAAQILAQVQDVFLVELPAHLLFKTTTVAGMAALITEARKKQVS